MKRAVLLLLAACSAAPPQEPAHDAAVPFFVTSVVDAGGPDACAPLGSTTICDYWIGRWQDGWTWPDKTYGDQFDGIAVSTACSVPWRKADPVCGQFCLDQPCAQCGCVWCCWSTDALQRP